MTLKEFVMPAHFTNNQNFLIEGDRWDSQILNGRFIIQQKRFILESNDDAEIELVIGFDSDKIRVVIRH